MDVINLKPIFHCNAKPFALVPHVGFDPQRHNFALGIPKCWYLKMLKFALPPMRPLKLALTCITPTPNGIRWNIGGVGWHWPCSFHVVCVHFMANQRELSFQWIGFTSFFIDLTNNEIGCMWPFTIYALKVDWHKTITNVPFVFICYIRVPVYPIKQPEVLGI